MDPQDAQFVQLVITEAAKGPLAGRYDRITPRQHSDGAIAAGAFSVVFDAYDVRRNADVALKFLRPNADAYRTACFEREASVLEAFSGHDHVLQLAGGLESVEIALTSSGGILYPLNVRFFATEVAKESLSEFLVGKARPRTLHRRLEVMKDVVRGVARLHRHGYCHRDLKPDNIFLFIGGRAKVADLGTCRLSDGRDQLAPIYFLPVGDMRYAAPEMSSSGGMLPELYAGADWFSVGAILFEAITSQNLYVAIGLKDPSDIKRTIAAAQDIAGYSRQMATAATQYPIPHSADYQRERWLQPIKEETHRELTGLVRDLCNFDFNRREKDSVRILRRLEICHLMAERDFEQAQRRRRRP